MLEKIKSYFSKQNASLSAPSGNTLVFSEKLHHFFDTLKNPSSSFQENSKKPALVFLLAVSAYILSYFVIFGIEKYLGESQAIQPKAHVSFDLPPKKRFENYQIILTKNLMNASIELDLISNPDAVGAPVKSSLPYDLIGTLVFQQNDKSIATLIERNSKKTYPIRANEEIPGQIKVREVLPNRVVFINLQQNRNEYIELPESSFTKKNTIKTTAITPGSSIERVAGNKFQIPRSEIDSNLANINQILTQARALPDPEGFRLIQIQSGSIYEKLGLQNGDIITTINGEPLRDPLKAMEYFQQIKDLPGLDLSIKRNGQVLNYNYEFN